VSSHPLLARLASASRAALVISVVAACAAPTAPAASQPAPLPTASPTPAPATSEPVPTSLQPPNALLAVGGGRPTVGALGTYTWLGTGSDAPWLRGAPVKLPPGGAATVALEPPVALTSWSLKKTKPGDTDGSTARPIASGTGAVTFTVPSDGGTILLTVDFAANAGTANYFWALSPG
jgi:hypothetical protein